MKFMKNVFVLLVFCQASVLICMEIEKNSNNVENQSPFVLAVYKNPNESLKSAFYDLYIEEQDMLIQSGKRLSYVYKKKDSFFDGRIFHYIADIGKLEKRVPLKKSEKKDFVTFISNELKQEKKFISFCENNIDKKAKLIIYSSRFAPKKIEFEIIPNGEQFYSEEQSKVPLKDDVVKKLTIVLEDGHKAKDKELKSLLV